jgi:hypothetical protein
MIKVTTDLQNTVRGNAHIQTVYFDQNGDFFLNAHKHGSKFYHRIKKQVVTDRAKVNARPETIHEAKPEHELIESLTREEVLASKPENETPLTPEAQSLIESMQKELKEAKKQIESLSKKPEAKQKEEKGKEEKIKA